MGGYPAVRGHSFRASPSRKSPASLSFSSWRHLRLPITPRSGVPGGSTSRASMIGVRSTLAATRDAVR